MKKLTTILAMVLMSSIMFAQTEKRIIHSEPQKLTIKGYAQIDYNQHLSDDTRHAGTLDVHRMVMLFGYKFNNKTSFISEIEFEHVSEVYIEQAYLNHKINNSLNFKAGLLLIPMGIINEYHEPPSFNGVERPNIDKYITPTTWREVGAGISGRIDHLSIKYQAYVVNGFKSYDDGGLLSGKNGLRKGRQKGAESFVIHPNFAGRLDYYGISGLKFGVSGYFGKTQSNLYDGIEKKDNAAIAAADSSVVGVSMLGVDARYSIKGFSFRGQYYLANITNTTAYNAKTDGDLGSMLSGYYVEAAYNVLSSTASNYSLVPFVRFENYNTHAATESNLAPNEALNKTEITTGIGFSLAPGAILKADIQFISNEATSETSKQLNMGVGIWF